MLATCSQLYASYFTASSEQPWRPQGDCSPRKVWSNGAQSPNQEGARQDHSALMEKGCVRPGEEEELGGLSELSAKVLWNGLRGPFNSQDMTPRAADDGS